MLASTPPPQPLHSASPRDQTRSQPGVCNLCEAICGLRFEVAGEGDQARITDIRGNPNDPLSRGHICPKAVALKDLHEDPDRLRQPVKRVCVNGETQWQTIGWDEAFDLVVDGLVRVREQHGRHAVAVYQGNPSVHNWGNLTHAPLFFGQLKTRNRFSATSVDQLPHHLVAHWLYGHQLRIPIPDIDHTQYLLILGGNPLASNGSLMTAPDMRGRLKALRSRGGKLIVVDPRRTETADIADEHLSIDPGTDAAWLLSLIHTLFDENLCRQGPLSDLLDHTEALREAVLPFSPEVTATHTGIDASTTRRTARELAQADGGVVYGRMGVSTQAHGVVCQWAIQVLNLLTGQTDRRGGALLTRPLINLISLQLMGPGHFDVWRSRVRGAPEFGGELPVSIMAEEMLTPGRDQVRALVTACGNPVLSTPNGRQLDRALTGLDFMASIDFYINETTRHAHVILPPTCAVEHDHYDLVLLHLAVRNFARYSPAVLPPADGAKHDWQIYAALAQRYARRAWPLQRASTMQRLKGSLTRTLMRHLPPHRLLALGLWRTRSTVRWRQLRTQTDGVDLGPLQPALAQTLGRERRRVPLLPAGIVGAWPELLHRFTGPARTDPDANQAPADLPSLKLIGRRDVRSNNSWMHNSARLVSGKVRCTLWMHPQDADARQLADGQRASVRSRVGTIEVPVKVTSDIRPGVVSLPHGWGHDRPGARLSVARAHAGASINDLTDDRLTDHISANAAFSAVPVWVVACTTP